MPLIRCKCGRYTNNGFLCTNCQRDASIDSLYAPPEDTEEEELEESGFTILESLEGYDDDELED